LDFDPKGALSMKTKVFLLLALSIVMVSTGANAAMLTADCDGWTSSGSFTMPTDLEFTIYLYQGGELIWSYTETSSVTFENPYFLFTGEWPMELCGDYTAHLDLNYNMGAGWRLLTYDTEFTCECDEPGSCTFTPGYWKNHPEDWPVTSLTVGCIEYSQAKLLDIFDWPTKGDMTIKLFHHLVAAKLNVLSGADDYIMDCITAGDDFLCANLLLSKPVGALKDEAEDIKDCLADYNEIPCCMDNDDDMLSISGPAATENAAGTVESSWGSIKKKSN
jgi:hypothetical protein